MVLYRLHSWSGYVSSFNAIVLVQWRQGSNHKYNKLNLSGITLVDCDTVEPQYYLYEVDWITIICLTLLTLSCLVLRCCLNERGRVEEKTRPWMIRGIHSHGDRIVGKVVLDSHMMN